MAPSLHLGIDLGVTNLKWSVVEREGADWRVTEQGQAPTHASEGARAVRQRLIDMARERCARWDDVASVGIGVPGLYDPEAGTTRFLVNVPDPAEWRDLPVAPVVADALAMPCALINDARAFGLAELRLGAARGASSMVGLTLGTGVGGVIAVDGRIHQGHDGTAGEIGHQTIDPDGPWCGCGNRGCLEAYARADQIAAACGTATAEEAVRAAQAGDERARAGLAQVGRYLGIGIANMVVLISPDCVVIGGGVAAAGDLLFEPVRGELRRRVRTTSLAPVELVRAELGTWAGAIGAAVHGAERAEASSRPIPHPAAASA
jgi:glucokinase